MVGIETGQGIDLEKVQLPGCVRPHIHAAAVPTTQSPVGRKRDFAGLFSKSAFNQRVFNTSFPLLFVLIRICRWLSLFLEHHLHYSERECFSARAHDAHGKFAAWHKRFYEDGLSELFQKPFADSTQLVGISNPRLGRDPFPRSFGDGFCEHGKRQIHPSRVFHGLDNGKIGRRHAEVAYDPFRHPLVQRERKDHRIGKRIGYVICFKERRDLGLAAKAPESLGNVEYHVPSVAVHESPCKAPDVPDAIRLMTEALKRSLNRLYRVRPVELGGFFFAKTLVKIILTQVICDAYFHGVQISYKQSAHVTLGAALKPPLKQVTEDTTECAESCAYADVLPFERVSG